MESSRSAAVAPLVIRDLSSPAELRVAEQLQKDVWGVGDREVVPLTQFVAARAAGGVLLGAFDGDTLAGFAYGFPSIDEDGPAMHSHLLAVRPEYRRQHVGYDLKRAQRERTLAKGLTRMTWTFDPLRPINAHLNFARLGVVADRYLPNFYGIETDSDLDRNGTDRLWVTWFLDSPRVTARLHGAPPPEAADLLARARALVRVGPDGHPVAATPTALVPEITCVEHPAHGGRPFSAAGQAGLKPSPSTSTQANSRLGQGCRFFIEIADTNRDAADIDLSSHWRRATCAAFTRALEAGYRVEEYYARPGGGASPGGASPSGVYVLVPHVSELTARRRVR